MITLKEEFMAAAVLDYICLFVRNKVTTSECMQLSIN